MWCFLIIIVLFVLVNLLINRNDCCCKEETFSMTNIKKSSTKSSKKPLDVAWKERWRELNTVPVSYASYFKILPQNTKQIIHKPDIIFISVASYRDNQCIDTVQNIASMADKPENLHFVICQQNSILEKDCMKWCVAKKEHPACKLSVSKIERLNYLNARGPTWARYRIQQEWTGEEYFLQIDAHTRMIKGWDTILKEQLEMCPSDKPILTQYPLEFDIVPENKRGDSTNEKWQLDKMRNGLYIQKFDDPDGFTRIQSDYTKEIRKHPFKSVGWAAGFSFSKGEFVKEAGYDPYTPFLFFGEEMDIAIRAFTHGWDFFSPSANVVFHNYKRDHRRTFWEKPEQKPLEVLSRFRIYVKLGYISADSIPLKYRFILNKMEEYNIGTQRSIKDYEQLCGIDISREAKI